MKIALIAMAAKPYHIGHDMLVRLAAKENDRVKLFVSLTDRVRKGEFPVRGSAMKILWENVIEKSLPENVTVSYGGSPVTRVFEELESAEAMNDENTYVLYADSDDSRKRYTENSLKKSCNNLYINNRVIIKGIVRADLRQISGTMMRSFMASGDKESFANNLPLTIDSDYAWKILVV